MIAMRLLFALPFALAACSGGSDDPAGNTTSTDSGAAPQPMNEEAALIENEALAPLPEPPANMNAGDAALPGITAPPVAPRPQPTATQAPDQGRETAARLVHTYYDRIAKGDYAAARAMWDDGGAASGLTAAQFAERFGRYTDMKVEVGLAGRIDGGAGQRYVEVPVRVSGLVKDGGEPIDRQGVVTLHRTGDIEGATPTQQRWRIAAAEILPTPTESVPAIATARYQCANGTQLIARFDKGAGTMSLRRGYQRFEPLQQQQSGSGIWYKGEGGEVRGKGDAATITLPGEAPTECKSR
jgi:hypothetical protein